MGIPLLVVACVGYGVSRCSPAGSSAGQPSVPAATTGAGRGDVASSPATISPATAGAGVPHSEPDVGRPLAISGLFTGRDLIYATHGFSTAEVAALAGKVTGPVTAVFSSEQMVASHLAGYPDIAVDTLIADPTSTRPPPVCRRWPA